jgi:hypothetical protein
MGFKVDFGGTSDDKKFEDKKFALLEEGTHTATFLKFESGLSSQKGTPYIRPVFTGVLDAQDTDGNEWPESKQVWSDWETLTFYITEKAMWRLKKLASELGVELPDAEEEFDSFGEFVEEMNEAFGAGNTEYTIEVAHNPSTKDPSKVYANVVSITQ